MKREHIEWCDIQIWHAEIEDLHPRVLCIGDSITINYFYEVNSGLTDKAYCARIATSRFLADPIFHKEISLGLAQYQFDIIHFNNGLHGWDYSEEVYDQHFDSFIETLQQHAGHARLIWASTTPVRNKQQLAEFDEKTARVQARNAIARQHIQRYQIPENDLYNVVADHPEYYSNDGVHMNGDGNSALARQVVSCISQFI